MKPSSIKDKTLPPPKERRNQGRKAHSGSIFFATKKKLFEGELINYSRAGLGIRVFEQFVAGESLIVALPFDEETTAKRPAKVVWCNGKGLGAKFVR